MEPAELSCNCSLANSRHHIVKEICTTKQYLGCFFKVYYKDQESRTEKCKHQCPPRCHYWQYDKTVSYAKFPSKEDTKTTENGDNSQQAL
uniref:Uncharacterized protein n=1 Tax=Acrobeloides nanus TaxID=290746 RepID=A0A914BWU7_9BILA